MMTPLLGQLLALVIVIWGIWIILSPVMPRMGSRTGTFNPQGCGCLGRIFSGLFFAFVVPVIWQGISLVGRLYQRSFVVFTEFASGVADWPTYRTSSFKYIGALFAFLGFNGCIVAVFALLTLVLGSISVPGQRPPSEAWFAEGILVSAGVGCCLAARFFFRRMP